MSRYIETVRRATYIDFGNRSAVRITLETDGSAEPTARTIQQRIADGFVDRETSTPKVRAVAVTGA